MIVSKKLATTFVAVNPLASKKIQDALSAKHFARIPKFFL
jgi:hypothetical protein